MVDERRPVAERKDEFRTTRLCGISVIPGEASVQLRRSPSTGEASVLGTTSCGSANGVCPVCTARVREQRRREIANDVYRLQLEGYQFAFITGTLRHTRETGPAQQRAALEGCWRAVTQGKQAQARKDAGYVAGTVRAIEFMLAGPAGPHGHIHAIIAIAPGANLDRAGAAFDAMGERWKTCAESKMDGLRPDDAHGWVWELAEKASDVAEYVTKLVDGEWNITHELARGDVKRGTGGSMSPLQLLEHAVDAADNGDFQPMLLMADYARAVKGMRSIVVSRSWKLAAHAELTDPSDAELAAVDDAPDDSVTLAHLSIDAWNQLARSLGVGRILQIVSEDGMRGIADLVKLVDGYYMDSQRQWRGE